jgi:hypothetical protein
MGSLYGGAKDTLRLIFKGRIFYAAAVLMLLMGIAAAGVFHFNFSRPGEIATSDCPPFDSELLKGAQLFSSLRAECAAPPVAQKEPARA